MTDIHADGLLREALAFLNARPFIAPWPRAAMRRRDLATRITGYLQSRSGASLIDYHRARALVFGVSYLCLDPPDRSDTGSWVPAWIQLPPSVATRRDLERIENAIAELSPMARHVFLAHRDRDLDYLSIANELGIEVSEVQRLLSVALLALDEALHHAAQRGWLSS